VTGRHAPAVPAGYERPGLARDPDRPAPLSAMSLVIWRAQGAVVVRLHGSLDRGTSETLERVLTDLIEGQGNLAVVLDMKTADVVDPEALTILRVAADQARSRGGRFALSQLSADARRALGRARLGDDIEIVDLLDIEFGEWAARGVAERTPR